MQLTNINRIIFGRSEVTVTVFVPWDCNNNCKFCTTKHEYKTKYLPTMLQKNMANIKSVLNKVTESPIITDIVFTGGEPFERLDLLSELIDSIHDKKHKRIFINTSFTISKDKIDAAVLWLKQNCKVISGVSISCPLHGFNNLNIVKQMSNRFKYFPGFLRLNAIVNGTESKEDILKFINMHMSATYKELNFRADYRMITQNTLHSADDQFFRTLMSINKFEYLTFSGCLVCRSDIFKYKKHMIIYHRGVNDTHLVYDDLLIVNDFVIKQDGELRYDWNDECIADKLFTNMLNYKE